MADALQKEISDELNKLQTSIPALVSRVSELESLIISTYTHIKELEDKAKSTERKGGFIDATVTTTTIILLIIDTILTSQRDIQPPDSFPTAHPTVTKPNSPPSHPSANSTESKNKPIRYAGASRPGKHN